MLKHIYFPPEPCSFIVTREAGNDEGGWQPQFRYCSLEFESRHIHAIQSALIGQGSFETCEAGFESGIIKGDDAALNSPHKFVMGQGTRRVGAQ